MKPKEPEESSMSTWSSPMHFSPAGCQNPKPLHSTVECLFYDDKAYYSVHRVGEFPWKAKTGKGDAT